MKKKFIVGFIAAMFAVVALATSVFAEDLVVNLEEITEFTNAEIRAFTEVQQDTVSILFHKQPDLFSVAKLPAASYDLSKYKTIDIVIENDVNALYKDDKGHASLAFTTDVEGKKVIAEQAPNEMVGWNNGDSAGSMSYTIPESLKTYKGPVYVYFTYYVTESRPADGLNIKSITFVGNGGSSATTAPSAAASASAASASASTSASATAKSSSSPVKTTVKASSASPAASSKPGDKKGLGTGAIIGIAAAGVVVIGGVIVFIIMKNKK